MNNYQKYFNAIKKTGKITEQSHRTALENLLNEIKPNKKIKIIQEPNREQGFGAPDFRIEIDGAIIGYIETKDIGTNLNKTIKTAQIKKYLSVTENLIVTNYSEFILLHDKNNLEKAILFDETDIEKRNYQLQNENIEKVRNLFEKFFVSEPIMIGNSKKLAEHFASRGRILKDYVFEILKAKKDDRFSIQLIGLKDAFKKTLVEDLHDEEFANAYTQTVLYGFFLAYLQSNTKITIEDAHKLIPLSFEVIKEFFKIIDDEYEYLPTHIKWIFSEIVNLINNVDLQNIYAELSFKNKKADPYLYFYEDFLKEYDSKERKQKGVYYTPFEVVSFITRSIDKILIEKFNKDLGFADSSVTVLDFASGTGTFLVGIFEIIFNKINRKDGRFISLIKEHILKNFYGFEYLVAPYAVCHLKLSQLIKDEGYNLEEKERFQVYLTDTLDNGETQGDWHLPALSTEGEKANKIKNKEPILVITGNPPYNIHSRNNKSNILELNKDYIPADEKNVQPLNDDYIKFIRFANEKMKNNKNGVVGIISNNSFLNGLLHRKMRNKLLNDFNEIYILNLHGNSRINEKNPDGGKDENVFDIQQGVAISFFVKNEKSVQHKLFYYDFFGSRKFKNEQLMNNDISTLDWKEIEVEKFNAEFGKTKWGKNRFKDDLSFFIELNDLKPIKEYGDYWGITEIFKNYKSGIQTGNDKLFIKQNLDEAVKVYENMQNLNVNEFKDKYKFNPSPGWGFESKYENLEYLELTKIHYRPFDIRNIVYSYALRRNSNEIMKHFLQNENLGLCFMRQVVINAPLSHFLITNTIPDLKILRSSEGTAFTAPLFLFNKPAKDDLFAKEEHLNKTVNFTENFNKFINTKYSFQPTPEQIIAYIYAVFHSPSFREKYLELLKIDFPRLPFLDEKIFIRLSEIGSELIEHHLLKKTYPESKIKAYGNSPKVEKILCDDERVYINSHYYFYPVSREIWNFYIGGYQVLEKWLKSRKGRELSYSEINHFIKVCNIIKATLDLMKKIDEIVRF